MEDRGKTRGVAAARSKRPIAFGNNDGRAWMLAGAVRSYINRYAAVPRQGRLAVFRITDDGWRTAADAQAAGIEIAAVIDSRAVPERFAALACGR